MPIQQEHTKAFNICNSFEYAMLLACGGMLLSPAVTIIRSQYCTAKPFLTPAVPAISESCTVQPLGTWEGGQAHKQTSTSIFSTMFSTKSNCTVHFEDHPFNSLRMLNTMLFL